MAITPTRPALPRLSLPRIREQRKSLTRTMLCFEKVRLTADAYWKFVAAVQFVLPSGINQSVVHESVKSLLGKTLSSEMAVATAARLAGNLTLLRDGKPVSEWRRQHTPEWCLVRIVDVTTLKGRRGYVNQMTFASITGTIVPHSITQRWSFKKTNYLATARDASDYGFGFGRSYINQRGEQRGRCLFSHAKQFHGLHCFLLIDPERSQTEPFASEVAHSAMTTAYNRELIHQRDRRESPCIKGLPRNVECFACICGEDRCKLATHVSTYVSITCSRCQSKSFTDPGAVPGMDVCLDCYSKGISE